MGGVVVLCPVSNGSFGDSLSDGVDLGGVTTASNAHADVDRVEVVLAEDEDGFVNFVAQDFGLHEGQGLAVDADEALALLSVCDGGGGLRALSASSYTIHQSCAPFSCQKSGLLVQELPSSVIRIASPGQAAERTTAKQGLVSLPSTRRVVVADFEDDGQRGRKSKRKREGFVCLGQSERDGRVTLGRFWHDQLDFRL